MYWCSDVEGWVEVVQACRTDGSVIGVRWVRHVNDGRVTSYTRGVMEVVQNDLQEMGTAERMLEIKLHGGLP